MKFSPRDVTLPFPMLWPPLAVISRNISDLFASFASFSSIIPGCARISTSPLSIALLFVPGITGSTGVSPWTTIIFAPSFFALTASFLIVSGGT